MKRYLSTLLLLSFIQFAMAQPDFYYLQVYSQSAEVECFLNGFPVYEIAAASPVSNTVPVQLFLVGKNNQLTLEVKPVASDGDTTGTDTVRVSGKIVPYKKDESISSDDERKGILEFEVVNLVSDFAEQERLMKTWVFDNEKFNYSAILKKSRILQEKEVLEYGMQLYLMAENANSDGLVEEMEVKISDYAKSFGQPVEALRDFLKMDLEATFLIDVEKKLDFNEQLPSPGEAGLSAMPYCDGRIWELLINGAPFFYKEEAGGYSILKMYVAKIDGKLAVVR